jgi:hypothetical protein
MEVNKELLTYNYQMQDHNFINNQVRFLTFHNFSKKNNYLMKK